MNALELSIVATLGLYTGAMAAEGAPASGQLGLLKSAAVKKLPSANFATCAKPVWPKHALRMQQQGTVTLAYLIGEDGAVRESKLVKSSGHPLLDIAALESMAKCRFHAGTVGGRAVASWTRMQYVWTIKDHRQPKPDMLAELQQRAEQGDPKAQYQLANLHLSGNGVVKDRESGTDWTRRAAEQGYPEAQERLGMLLIMASPGPAPQEAVAWMMRAAEQGYVRAQAYYGNMLLRGDGVPADARAAIDWLTRSAEGEHPLAQGVLGALMLKEQPERAEEALTWLRKGAAQDDGLALLVLADAYDRGRFVEQDRDQALALYSKAAQAGNKPAMLRLAERYQHGDGVAADPDKAMQLRAAARAAPPPVN